MFKITYNQCPVEPVKTLHILEALLVYACPAADPTTAVTVSSCSWSGGMRHHPKPSVVSMTLHQNTHLIAHISAVWPVYSLCLCCHADSCPSPKLVHINSGSSLGSGLLAGMLGLLDQPRSKLLLATRASRTWLHLSVGSGCMSSLLFWHTGPYFGSKGNILTEVREENWDPCDTP